MREPNPEFTPLLQKLFTPGNNVSKMKTLKDLQVEETRLQFDAVPISQVRKITLEENASSVCKKFGLSFLHQNDMFLIQFLYGFKNKTLCKKTLLFGKKIIHTFCFLKQKSLVAKSKQEPRPKMEEFKLLEMQEEFRLEMEMENSCF